jgi:HNH endonuclease
MPKNKSLSTAICACNAVARGLHIGYRNGRTTMTALPTPEQLRALLRYDPDTGKLFWLPRPDSAFASMGSARAFATRFADKEAFTARHCQGYRQGNIGGHVMLAHRVIWAIVTGEWPKDDVDHIDTDRSNNAWGNLRAATRSQNCMNASKPSSNTSGYKGVDWNAVNKKWRARITANGKDISLGYFNCSTAAVVARAVATPRIHGEFGRI